MSSKIKNINILLLIKKTIWKEKHMKKDASIGIRHWCWFWAYALSAVRTTKIGSNGYDPSKPVVFSDFTPDHGSLRTQIHIYGDNFGTDPSKIHITIGGQYTTTIGCTNTEIYCIVPPKAFDGNIKIKIESADGKTSPIEYEFEKKFNYTLQPSVSTLVGSEDENGNSSDVDGNFEKSKIRKSSGY